MDLLFTSWNELVYKIFCHVNLTICKKTGNHLRERSTYMFKEAQSYTVDLAEAKNTLSEYSVIVTDANPKKFEI